MSEQSRSWVTVPVQNLLEPVRVYLCGYIGPMPGRDPLWAPDPRWSPMLIGLYGGENFNGPIRLELYVSQVGDDGRWITLWIADGPWQDSNDQAYMVPFCMLPADWMTHISANEEQDSNSDQLGCHILFWVYCQYAGHDEAFYRDIQIDDGLLTESDARTIIHSALAGQPVSY